MVLSLLVGLWVARYLGPTGFGLLNFSTAFVALFAFLGDLGLQAVVIRDLVRWPEKRLQIVISALAVRLIGTLLALIVIGGSILLLRGGDSTSRALVLVQALGLIPQVCDVIDFDYQARMHPRPVTIIRILSLIVAAGMRIVLITHGAHLIWFAWAIVTDTFVSAFLMLGFCWLKGPVLAFSHLSIAEMQRLVKECWPLAIASLSVMLYMRVDQVMIGQILDDRAVGIFSAAVRVSESWYFIPMAVLAAVSPYLTAQHQLSNDRYQKHLIFLTRAMFGLSIIVAVVFTFSAGRLTEFLYGKAYGPAASVLAVHAWAGVFANLGIAAGPWFVNAGILKIRMTHTLIGALVNVVMNLWMIPRFGVVGAAVSTLVSYSAAAFWLNAISPKTRPLFFMQAKSLLMI
jgi:PST family polysaccharide transporter